MTAPAPTDDEATVHLRMEKSLKARWVALSRQEGMKLTDWIIQRVEREAPPKAEPNRDPK